MYVYRPEYFFFNLNMHTNIDIFLIKQFQSNFYFPGKEVLPERKSWKGEVSRLRGFMTYILLCCVVGEGGGLGKKKYIINKNNIYKEKETG